MPDGKIIFNNYKPTKRNRNRKNVIVAIFFDGTTNNRTNIAIYRARQKKKSGAKLTPEEEDLEKRYPSGRWDMDSYKANDESNIARMEPCYLKEDDTADVHSLYIEGPGTEDGDSDTVEGYLYGDGETGIKAKMMKAVTQLIDECLDESIEANLILDVYGFSRGAATARHFVHFMTTSPVKLPEAIKVQLNGSTATISPESEPSPKTQPYEYIKYKNKYKLAILLNNQDKAINTITIRFVGLYDTVSSYSDSITPLPNFDNDVAELNLDCLGHSKVKSVVQLAAADEIRKNFSLTNIHSAGTKGLQIFLPGAHSDIGASYLNKQTEVRTYSQTKVGMTEQDLQDFINEGWYTPYNSTTKQGIRGVGHVDIPNHPDSVYSYLEGKRILDNRYAHIPLHIMCELAGQRQSSFDMGLLQSRNTIPNQTNHILRYAYNQLEQYVEEAQQGKAETKRESYKDFISLDNLKVLRRKFLHISYNNSKIGYEANANKQRKIING